MTPVGPNLLLEDPHLAPVGPDLILEGPYQTPVGHTMHHMPLAPTQKLSSILAVCCRTITTITWSCYCTTPCACELLFQIKGTIMSLECLDVLGQFLFVSWHIT